MKEIRLNFPEDEEVLKINIWNKKKTGVGRIMITSFIILKIVSGKTTSFTVVK